MMLKGGEEKVIPFTRNNMFREELKHFAEWVAAKGIPRVGADTGLRSTRIAEFALCGGGLF